MGVDKESHDRVTPRYVFQRSGVPGVPRRSTAKDFLGTGPILQGRRGEEITWPISVVRTIPPAYRDDDARREAIHKIAAAAERARRHGIARRVPLPIRSDPDSLTATRRVWDAAQRDRLRKERGVVRRVSLPIRSHPDRRRAIAQVAAKIGK